MNKSYLIILCISALAFSSAKTQAALLVNGDSINLSGTTVIAQPELAGVIQNDNLISEFLPIGGNSIFGIGLSVQNRVVRSDVDGSLIFGPRIIPFLNNTSANFLIDRAILYGFGDYALDVDYRTDGLGDRGPTTVERSFDGNILDFSYLFPLSISNLAANPQESSRFLSINTSATNYNFDGRLEIVGRHLSFPGEVFTLAFDNIAVPTAGNIQVSAPAMSMVIFSLLSLSLFKRKTEKNI